MVRVAPFSLTHGVHILIQSGRSANKKGNDTRYPTVMQGICCEL